MSRWFVAPITPGTPADGLPRVRLDSTFINDWNYWKLFCACSDPNAQYIFVGNVCQCRAGHYLDATSQVCLACGAGEFFFCVSSFVLRS